MLSARLEREQKERAAAEAIVAEQRRAEAARIAEERRREESRARQARQKEAVQSLMGDILGCPPESAAREVELFSVIRHKVELFLSAGNQAVYNAICIDCAEFHARYGPKCPRASQLLKMLTAAMGRCYQLEGEAAEISSKFGALAASAEADIRAISSRSYVYGGVLV